MQRAGFWLGVALFTLMLTLPAPDGLSLDGWRTAAVVALMATWWFSEAVPVTLTGSLPFLILPLLGIGSPDSVAGRYMSPVLFLVLGGAMIGIAVEKWDLHRRMALAVIARAGAKPSRLLFALMCVTALVSMWVNNSATTVMMLPIATAILVALAPTLNGPKPDPDEKRFAAAMVLSVAYASNIGGVATPIATPVNPIVIGLLERQLGVTITFLEWCLFGIPLMILCLPLCWWILKTALPFRLAPGNPQAIVAAIGATPPMGTPEHRVLAVIAVTCGAWIMLPVLDQVIPGISDAGIAVAAALALCAIPSGERRQPSRGRYLIEWADARQAPWYLILLLGGGIALADAVVQTGLSAWLGQETQAAAGLPLWLLVLVVALLCSLVTECASNVATATIFMPIAATLALAGQYDPVPVALAAGMAASWGFANPAGTSSNAMVYGTGRVRVPDMLRSGLWLDVACAILITLTCVLLVPWLGLKPG
ncbi:MAG: SLC13/DASS family transporter [Sinobacteraceae bacterium]|nr:SLC13/DASS family transporter [Nevskiaceae bacterium]